MNADEKGNTSLGYVFALLSARTLAGVTPNLLSSF